MKPKKVTVESEREERRKAVCDRIVERAAEMMVGEAGASVGMVIDRMLTYAAAQACTTDGSPATAKAFRLFADKIDAGLFYPVTGEQHSGTSHH